MSGSNAKIRMGVEVVGNGMVGTFAYVGVQATQALFMNHTRNTIWRRIIRVCMGFSTRYP